MDEKEEAIIRDILKVTEALLVVAGGRPLLQALSFGGITKLSRRIFHFLEQGSIHRGQVTFAVKTRLKSNNTI